MAQKEKGNLKEKSCACGCGRKFKTSADSRQKYFSFFECDPVGIKKLQELERLEFGSK